MLIVKANLASSRGGWDSNPHGPARVCISRATLT